MEQTIPPTPDEPTFARLEPPCAYADQREHSRYNVELAIEFGSAHNFYAGFIENMSVGGVFIATYVLRPVGEVMTFCIHLPGVELPITGLGEVRWLREPHDESCQPGMGIRFLELDAGCDDAIRAYIGRHDPLFYEE
jgi:uncharacterized protein (TIGR02266 family)